MVQQRKVSISRNSSFGQGCEGEVLKNLVRQLEINLSPYELYKCCERVCDKCGLTESVRRIAVGNGTNH